MRQRRHRRRHYAVFVVALIYRNKTFITCVRVYHCRPINVLNFHIIMTREENNTRAHTNVNVCRVVCMYLYNTSVRITMI